MKLVILPSAWGDLAAGFHFYERQSEGVGHYFRAELIEELESLQHGAGFHRKVHGYHRLLAKKFPYAVYYRCLVDLVVVHAILDLRRNPKRLHKRLK